MPANYIPKNETERALQESLRNMEIQCKERVDLLDALRKSREEADKNGKKNGSRGNLASASQARPPVPPKLLNTIKPAATTGWMGDGTVPPASYPEISRAPPPLPMRPPLLKTNSNSPTERSHSSSQLNNSVVPPPPPPPPPIAAPSPVSYTPPTLPVPVKKTSRTPSPDKKGGRIMLTTLRGPKDAKGKPAKAQRLTAGRATPLASSKAAGLAWDTKLKPPGQRPNPGAAGGNSFDSQSRTTLGEQASPKPDSAHINDADDQALGGNAIVQPKTRTPPDLRPTIDPLGPSSYEYAQRLSTRSITHDSTAGNPASVEQSDSDAPMLSSNNAAKGRATRTPKARSPLRVKDPVEYPSYRTEFPPTAPSSRATAEFNARITRRDEGPKASQITRQRSPQRGGNPVNSSGISRRPVANSSSPRLSRSDRDGTKLGSSESNDENTSSGLEAVTKKKKPARKTRADAIPVDPALSSPTSKDEKSPDGNGPPKTWDERVKHIQKHLPKGVDEHAAKQIFNEIVVKGDEVHWNDVAGLDAAKKALKEAVVYPFLRPDLFLGLREPARGMLLFGPPGTGKTMLARAVATESRSTFFAISASSLTSKWLGESEKLVRALFSLAKALAPSIIFVDEIDSLLSSRGGSSEHESTRRIKTEFLIQWSDLQRAAAGKQQSDKEKAEGDASRVLVLAATNMPWAIDEAARRRFVRRQYIPLPEAPVRAEQLRTLLGHQKHNLNRKDITVLVELTDGTLHPLRALASLLAIHLLTYDWWNRILRQ